MISDLLRARNDVKIQWFNKWIIGMNQGPWTHEWMNEKMFQGDGLNLIGIEWAFVMITIIVVFSL